jgi:PTH1 family peptidyl-tRNA hydrolase
LFGKRDVRLVVGLGNPGCRYENTRHNVGFLVVDKLAGSFDATRARRTFESEVRNADIADHRVLLLKPRTYMNLSGRAVGACMHWHKLALADLLVICDDFNLPLGKIRFRRQGSSGGHKGLDSLILHLGEGSFARLRAGIGLRQGADPADYVLERFGAGERSEVAEMIDRAAAAVACWLKEGIDSCMNKYNA